jgi:heat shock protein HslJ
VGIPSGDVTMKLFIAAILITTCLSIAGCAPNNCGGDFEDILWKLKEYGTPGSLQPVVSGSDITIQFNNEDQNIDGFGGINHFYGSYTIKSNCGLELSGLNSTLIGSMDIAIAQQEQKYLNLLHDAESIEVTGNELNVICGPEVLVYTR